MVTVGADNGAASRSSRRTKSAAVANATLHGIGGDRVVTYESPLSCSTFSLAGNAVVGHNSDHATPILQSLVTNPRGVAKVGVSFEELVSGTAPEGPTLSWTSTYGSWTMHPFGREFPDAGANEAGLTVHEMTLTGSKFAEPDGQRPVLFTANWMQSILDRFATVAEVLEDLPRLVIDGWAWHFYVTDRTGQSAAIEFLGGQAKVHTGAELPVTALCNAPYAAELALLPLVDGFGGAATVDPADLEVSRFWHAARGLQADLPGDQVEHALGLLRTLERGTTQSQWVWDLDGERVLWSTPQARARKWVRLHDLDVSEGATPRIIDLHHPAAGDVTDLMEPLDGDGTDRLATNIANLFGDAMEPILQAHGGSMDGLVKRIADHGRRSLPEPTMKGAS